MVPFLVRETVPDMESRWEYPSGMEPNDPKTALAVVEALIGSLILAGSQEHGVEEIIATGNGASTAVCDVLANMTGAVVRQGEKDTVSLGAAIGAAHYTTGVEWGELTQSLCKTHWTSRPYPEKTRYYKEQYLPALRALIYGN